MRIGVVSRQAIRLDSVVGREHKVLQRTCGTCFGLDDTTFIATDALFERENAEANFLVAGGTVGLRSYSLTPTK